MAFDSLDTITLQVFCYDALVT